MIDRKEKRKFKKDAKRRMIEMFASIPFGVAFAYLFYWLKLSVGLQLFLTVVCWGAIIGIVELVFFLVNKAVQKREASKPKRRDPFVD